MAKVHKAHKSGKYSFQRNNKKVLGWVIGVAAVIVAIIIGVSVYGSSRTGDVAVTAPSEASLKNIAENWQVLASHTDKVVNQYAPYYEAGVDENGATILSYVGTELADNVQIYIKPLTFFETVENTGAFIKPNIFTADLAQVFSGEINMDDTLVGLQTGNEDVMLMVELYNPEEMNDAVLHAVIAELEALIAAGPAAAEAAPAEEAPAEAAPAEETTGAAE